MIFIFTFFVFNLLNASDDVDLFRHSPLKEHGVVSVDDFLKGREARLSGLEFDYSEKALLTEQYKEDKLISIHFMGDRFLPEKVLVYDPNHELMNGYEFTPRDMLESTSRVGFYSINGIKKLCFKSFPEGPSSEFATYLLYRMIYCSDETRYALAEIKSPMQWFLPEEGQEEIPMPSSETIIMNGMVFLVSKFMEGESLSSIFEKAREDSDYGKGWVFDEESFDKLFLFCLYLDQEDGRPQNYLVRKNKSGKYELVIIDGDRNFYYEGVDSGKLSDSGTRVHCSLFCFYSLLNRKMSNINLLEKIKFEPFVFWLKGCIRYNRHLDILLKFASEESMQKIKQRDLSSVVTLSLLSKVIKKLKATYNLYEGVGRNVFNLADILKAVNPEIACMYLDSNCTHSENHIRVAYDCAMRVDYGRSFSSVTPSSANVPFENWRHSTDQGFIDEIGSIIGRIERKKVEGVLAD